jgi:hypothetical protein
MIRRNILALLLVGSLSGCETKMVPMAPKAATPTPAVVTASKEPEKTEEVDEVAAERAKLSDADRKLVEAQEWCAISHEERLGSMGAPIKIDIKGESVFICCKGCKKRAEANPEKTLKEVAELKAKKLAMSAEKK